MQAYGPREEGKRKRIWVEPYVRGRPVRAGWGSARAESVQGEKIERTDVDKPGDEIIIFADRDLAVAGDGRLRGDRSGSKREWNVA